MFQLATVHCCGPHSSPPPLFLPCLLPPQSVAVNIKSTKGQEIIQKVRGVHTHTQGHRHNANTYVLYIDTAQAHTLLFLPLVTLRREGCQSRQLAIGLIQAVACQHSRCPTALLHQYHLEHSAYVRLLLHAIREQLLHHHTSHHHSQFSPTLSTTLQYKPLRHQIHTTNELRFVVGRTLSLKW